MSRSLKNAVNQVGSQTEKVRADQVENNAGGFVFTVSPGDWLLRFLILGTDGGTFYVTEKALALEAVEQVKTLIAHDEAMVRALTVSVSEEGRAYRNSPAIFVAAALLAYGQNKAAARAAALAICRTSTHLFELAEYIEALGGWGRSKREVISAWYQNKTPDQLAYQAVKYRQRNGWTHRDLLRLSHVKGVHPGVAEFILRPDDASHEVPQIIHGFRVAQQVTSPQGALYVLKMYKGLPWEALPTQVLSSPKVWEQIFDNGQLSGQALLRNIARLQKSGAFQDQGFRRAIAASLRNEEMIRKTRLHPMQYMLALTITGPLVPEIIVNALEDGLEASFPNHVPSGKNTLIALDVSSSMSWGFCAGVRGVTPAEASAMMAIITARTEEDCQVVAFQTRLSRMSISKRDSLKTVIGKVTGRNFGGTDCSLPMVWARETRQDFDTFIVLTDNETWAGREHPFKALQDYRQFIGHDARLVVQAFEPTKFTIADPTDDGMLDVVGLDASTPSLIADFSAGRF